jgi:hypothetical protein
MIITTTKTMRPREGHDFYPTPPALALAALQHYADGTPPRRVLDPGAGTGVWGRAVLAHYRTGTPELTGVDLFAPPCPDYATWIQEDYLTWHGPGAYDLICGNPPYSLAEAFIRRAHSQLAPGGSLILLLRLAFLASIGRGRGLWAKLPPTRVGICMQRPSFTGNNRTDATEYALFYWRQGGPEETVLEWLDWKPQRATRQPVLFHEDAA